jgi:hypothetical protein
MPSPAEQAAPAGSKICVVCGKDVTGHRRLKDSRGYICYSCAKEEQRRERGGRVRCKGCGKLVLPAALNDNAGVMLCNQCLSERKKVQKQEIKRIGIGNVHAAHERKRLYILVLVMVLLGMVIILNKLHLLPHFF